MVERRHITVMAKSTALIAWFPFLSLIKEGIMMPPSNIVGITITAIPRDPNMINTLVSSVPPQLPQVELTSRLLLPINRLVVQFDIVLDNCAAFQIVL